MDDRNHDENPLKISDLIEITPQKRPFTTSPSNNGALSNSPIEHIRSVAKAEINEDFDTSNEVNKTVAAGKSSMVGSSIYTRSLAESNSGRKGLNNLGNTCFMNSALQCLSASPLLTAYFLRGDWADELNSTNPLGMGGEIPKAYAKVIKNLWLSDLQMPSSSYAPREFKYTIGQRNPTFVGYGQQDSHELLQSLLDGLHEDLNRIRNRAYQEDPEYDPKKMTEDDFAKLSWESYKKINDSIIVDLFQGQLKSRTECQVCFRSSIKFDPYMYLQLPIPEPLTQNMIVRVFESSESIRKEVLSVIESINIPGNVITEDEITQYMDFLELTKKCLDQFRIKEISVSVPRNGSIKDLKTEIAKQLNWDSIENINCVDIFNSKIYKKFEDYESINSISPNDTIYISIFASVKKMRADPALFNYLPRDSKSFSLIEPSVSTITFIELSNRISTSTEHSILVPMFLSLPSTFYFDPPLTSQEEFGKVIGELLYRIIAEKLAPFSKIPLFRIKGSNILLADLIEADSNSPCATKISFFPLSDDWECIPNLFEISVDISDGGPVVIYPFSASGYPSTASKSDVNSDHNLLAGHKSDLSDLTHRMERNGSIESEPDESLDSTLPSLPQVSEEEENVAKEDFSYFSHSGDYNIRVSFAAETTKILFGVSNNTYSYRDAKYETFEPIATQSLSRQDEQIKPISLNECMAEFTKEELLDGADTIYCSKCKEHQPTKKQLSVYSLPEILVVHLKRFSNSGRISSRSKLDCFIDAPEVGLDMTSLISGRKEDVLYDLFAVSNHFGSLGGGHYTAYAKNPLDEKWYNCDDSYVSITSEKVITKAAYLLFYQRRSSKKIDFTKIVQDSNENLALEVKKKADEEEKRYQDEIERKKTLFYQAEVESASTLETNETEVESFPSSFEEKSPSRSL